MVQGALGYKICNLLAPTTEAFVRMAVARGGGEEGGGGEVMNKNKL